jgi:signal transduction histidine kinase
MFSSLRARLLLSYIAVIGLTLCVASVVLLALLSTSPLPNRLAYQRLRDIARASLPQIDPYADGIDAQLARVAATNDIRTLRIDANGMVLFDSAGVFQTGDRIELQDIKRSAGGLVELGTYRNPGGRLWLFVALDTGNTGASTGLIMLAVPRPLARPYDVLGTSLLRPLSQAGLIGLIVAVVLAAGVAASVARPLRRAAAAARAIAAGDYSQRVPEYGADEAREMARAFNHMADEVQHVQQTQRDFLANAAHELKTPLTSIQGYSQAILDGAASDPERAAQIIYDEAGRMRRLVEDLLDLARIESGQAALRRELVDLVQLLEMVLDNLALRAAEKGVTLLRETTPLPRVTGDGDRLAQVLTNLLDNAIAHTPSGGQVTVHTAQQEDGVAVAIKDNGPGIPAADLDRIFERFYQVDKSRVRGARKGTGLGLTISREIVEAHGGRIQAESREGDGACFTIWLPLVSPAVKRGAR